MFDRRTTLISVALILLIGWNAATFAAEPPVSATATVASATVSSATENSTLLKGMDKSAEVMVDVMDNTIESSRNWIVNLLGGPDAVVGKFVDNLFAFVQKDFLGWPISQYLLSFFIILFAFSLRQSIAKTVLAFLVRFASKTKTKLDDELVEIFKVLIPPIRTAIALAGIYISVQVFFRGQPPNVPPESLIDQARQLFRGICYLVILIDISWAFMRLADVGVQYLTRVVEDRETLLDNTFVPILQRTTRIFIIIITALQILYHFEFGAIVNSLLAAAGVSGLAIGLAAQDTIKNFFGSVVLLIDRPFSIGDWIIAGETEGIVETVGFRSTKIRTFGKTLITIPNSSIVDRDIDNISRRKVRRIKFYLGVSYDTSPEQMEELLKRIRSFLRTDEAIWPNLILVRFTEFADSTLNIFIYCFSKTTDWDKHLAVREHVNLEIMRIVAEMGLEIAFPTQTLYLRQENSTENEPPAPSPENPT